MRLQTLVSAHIRNGRTEFSHLSNDEKAELTEYFIYHEYGKPNGGFALIDLLKQVPDEYLTSSLARLAGREDNFCDLGEFRKFWRRKMVSVLSDDIQDYINAQMQIREVI